jgi:uncharacterized cupredoxin-like copper-binding protein
MRWLAAGAVAIAVAVATALGGYAVSDTARADAAPTELGPGLVTVTVDIRYSHFSLSTLHVHAGTTVRFLIHNDDPINHEFIVGDARVHLLHELGHEKVHPPVPGEVSMPPDSIGETFYQFPTPGRYLFACHLPGHFAYGMKGWVVVDPVAA